MCLSKDTFLLGIFVYIIFPNGELTVSEGMILLISFSSLLFFVLLLIEPKKAVEVI